MVDVFVLKQLVDSMEDAVGQLDGAEGVEKEKIKSLILEIQGKTAEVLE